MTRDLTVPKSFLPTPNLSPYLSSLTNITPSSQLKIITELFFMYLEVVESGDKELQKTTVKMQIRSICSFLLSQ